MNKSAQAKAAKVAQKKANPVNPDVITGKPSPPLRRGPEKTVDGVARDVTDVMPPKADQGQGRGQGQGKNPAKMPGKGQGQGQGQAQGQKKPGQGQAQGKARSVNVGDNKSPTKNEKADAPSPSADQTNADANGPKVPAKVADARMPAEVKTPAPPAKPEPQNTSAPQAPKIATVSTKLVPPARVRRRHRFVIVTFILMVLLPAMGVVYYLYNHAQDRYASSAAFFVHREDSTPSVESMFGMPSLGAQSGSPDAEVLYQFIQSQQMVELADAALDLRARYGVHYDVDPVFALDPEASLEDMVSYWGRIVSLVFAPDSGLINLEVVAYDPKDAQALAQIILDESANLIDELSQIARSDSIDEAKADLDVAEERLRGARRAVAEFRSSSEFVDPAAVVAGSEGVIAALQQRLAEELIAKATLEGSTTREDDPRLDQANRRIAAIRQQIVEERSIVGADQATAVGAYEELLANRLFAEESYTAALAAYDAAVAEARRKSRYLAPHIDPTLAGSAIYPQRIVLSILGALFLFMVWAVMVLVLYSIRDRR